MLFSKIISIAQSQSDETYTTNEWVDLLNLCQADLTPIAKILKIEKNVPVTVEGGQSLIDSANTPALAVAHKILRVYFTPSGGKEVQLRRLSPWNNYSKGWKLLADQVHLQNLGSCISGLARIDYYKRLQNISAASDILVPESPEIPEEYHGLYVSFLCSKSQQREEEQEDHLDFLREYNEGKQALAVNRIASMEPWNLKNLRTTQGGD